MANLGETTHCIQSEIHPVLIAQNYTPGKTVEVIPLTTKLKSLSQPTHVVVRLIMI